MEVKEGDKVILQVPEEAKGAVLLKNLYLSCDPYMRGRMREYYESYIPPFQPGSVHLSIISSPFIEIHSLIIFDVNSVSQYKKDAGLIIFNSVSC